MSCAPYDRSFQNRIVSQIRYQDLKISSDDAAKFLRPNATEPTTGTTSPTERAKPRKWRPLHEAIAWVLTRRRAILPRARCGHGVEQRTYFAYGRLEQEMMEAGCFDAVKQTMQFEPSSPAIVILRHKLRPGYSGRFKDLAEEYEFWRR